MKYKHWLTEWLELYVKPSAKIRTYEKYEQFIRLHISPVLGETETGDLSAMVLQKFIAALTKKGLSAGTVNAIVTVLKNSLRRAVLSGIAENEYSGRLQRPKIVEKKMNCFTVSEQKQIEQFVFACRKLKLNGIILCLYTGLRIGELLALEWTDINFEQGLLSVTKTCHDGKGGRVTDTPKTETSRRLIPVPKKLMPVLRQWKRQAETPYVVEERGKCLGVRSYQKTFELLLKHLGLPHRGFHALRHTFATRAIECGMDVKTLSEILGHKNPTVTLKRYTHSLMEHKSEMMNRVGRLL